MAKYRPLKIEFWQDSWTATLTPSEKLVFLYLLTNKNTSLCGIYRVSIRYISFETGLTEKVVSDTLSKFQKDGKIIYKDEWLILKNHKKHQSNSPKIETGIERELKGIPQEIADLRYSIDTVSIEYDRVSKHIDKPEPKPKPKLKLISSSLHSEDSAGHAKIKKNLAKEPELVGDTETPPIAPPPSFGRDDINNMLSAIKGMLTLTDFRESKPQQRIWGKNLVGLLGKLGREEFGYRFKVIIADDFKRKNCGSLQFIHKEIKGFVPSSNQNNNFLNLDL